MVFLPKEHASRLACEQELERAVRASEPGAARLARRAGRPRHADVAGREGERAGDPPDLHRPRARSDGDRRARAQALHHPQVGGPCDPGAEAQARQGILRAVDVGAHGRLQGPAAGRPGRRLLQGPADPRTVSAICARAPALLDQHVPELGARASVPDGRAQRRDQHRQGQRQLDQRAPAGDLVAGARRRSRQDLAADLSGPVGHRVVRQLPRDAGDGRLLARPRDDDDDPRGVGAARADGREPPRVLRIPRGDDGAVGRPGRDRVHRRSPDRRDARPQRPAAGPLLHHRRRPRRDGVRGRRAADPRVADRQEVAAAARQDVPDRHRGRPHHRRRGAEELAREREAVSRVDQPHPHQARRAGRSGRPADRRRRVRPSRRRAARRCSIASRRSATRRKTCGC